MRSGTLIVAVGMAVLLGCGGSEKPDAKATDASLESLLQDVDKLLQNSDAVGALELLEPALEAHSDHLELLIDMARARNMLGRADLALAHLKKARQVDPKDRRVPYMLGRVYSDYGQWKPAVESFEASLELGMPRGEVRIPLGMAVGKLRDLERAVELFTEEIEKGSHKADGYYNRAVAYENTDRQALAIEDYRHALQIDPDMKVAMNGLARVLLQADDTSLRDPTEALALADRAVALESENADFLLTLALAQEANNDPASGVATLDKAFALVDPLKRRELEEHQARMRLKAGEKIGG